MGTAVTGDVSAESACESEAGGRRRTRFTGWKYGRASERHVSTCGNTGPYGHSLLISKQRRLYAFPPCVCNPTSIRATRISFASPSRLSKYNTPHLCFARPTHLVHLEYLDTADALQRIHHTPPYGYASWSVSCKLHDDTRPAPGTRSQESRDPSDRFGRRTRACAVLPFSAAEKPDRVRPT